MKPQQSELVLRCRFFDSIGSIRDYGEKADIFLDAYIQFMRYNIMTYRKAGNEN